MAGEHQPVLDIGPVDRLVVGQLRQLVRLHRPRVVAEGDHLEIIAWELAANQGVERQCHFLGGIEVAAQRHRPAHIDHQHRGRLGTELRAVDLEVIRLEADRLLRALTTQGVHQRPFDMEVEGVAELVDLGVLRAFRAEPPNADRVVAEAIPLEPRIEVTQGLLADAPHSARGELHAAPPALHVALLFQLRRQLAHLVRCLPRLRSKQLL